MLVVKLIGIIDKLSIIPLSSKEIFNKKKEKKKDTTEIHLIVIIFS